MPSFWLTRALQKYLRSPLQGRTRLTLFLARRNRTLQAVPIEFRNMPAVYMDLRMFDSHSWFRGSPWRESPREPNEQRIMERVVRPRDVAYDIGANLGLHMALLSRCVGAAGRVYAFEPNPALVRLLRLTAHEAGNCVLHNVALGDVEETAMLFVPDDHSMASLANWTNGRCGRTRQVRCDQVKLDHLIAEGLQPPDFIKCDVEGAELKVFTGARQTLDRSAAPIVLFEAGETRLRFRSG